MNERQREFILETFFKTEDFAGWRGIAEKLIDKGECIVAGEGDLWRGGIGNFITKEETEEAIGCTKLKFDISELVSRDNAYFMEYYNNHLEEAQRKYRKAREKCEVIKSLV